MGFWNGKSVMVTGGAGFLGTFVSRRLADLGALVAIPRKRDYDLVDLHHCERAMADMHPEVVIHGAAYYGGIWINQLYPGRIYYENLVMGANVMEAARRASVAKFVGIGTACGYPGYLEGDLSEDRLWDGIPHETVRNYGLTKKMMEIQGWAYRKQYDFDAIHLVLTNLYGPGDTFDPDRSHVAAALIRKFVEATQARADEVEVWGTGAPIRELLYVEDCAEAIVRAAERYSEPAAVNIGTGVGTSIRELAETIQSITGFSGHLRWNSSKPDGQLKKVLDVTRMRAALGWVPPTNLRDGLEKTIKWYAQNKSAADARA